MSIGFILPFQQATGSLGHFQMTNDVASAVAQDVRSLLLTNWGERVMHYNFGCNFREFLFEQKSGEQLKLRIADRINSQISAWLPIVEILKLNILFTEDLGEIPENGIGIAMEFRLKNNPDLMPVKLSIVIPA